MYKFVLLPGSVYINPEIQSSERDLLRKENNYQSALYKIISFYQVQNKNVDIWYSWHCISGITFIRQAHRHNIGKPNKNEKNWEASNSKIAKIG